MVAEKGRFSSVKVYRVDYPRGLLLNESDCPHCGKPALRRLVSTFATARSGDDDGDDFGGDDLGGDGDDFGGDDDAGGGFDGGDDF